MRSLVDFLDIVSRKRYNSGKGLEILLRATTRRIVSLLGILVLIVLIIGLLRAGERKA